DGLAPKGRSHGLLVGDQYITGPQVGSKLRIVAFKGSHRSVIRIGDAAESLALLDLVIFRALGRLVAAAGLDRSTAATGRCHLRATVTGRLVDDQDAPGRQSSPP